MIELAKMYQPEVVEGEIAGRWNDSHAFHAEPDNSGRPYCIVMPPPNVTAALHLGHALNNTLQDILIRYHRMLGDNTLWVPGTDHAGIATQTVVEKHVLEEEGKKRIDFERDTFVAKIQAWKDEYETRITEQLKAMGCSCDWDRQRFTMDELYARAVRQAFFHLFKDGLIYRGKRLVNWDPATQTALADDEVEMREVDGHFYYLRYPLADPTSAGVSHVTVATTRPETMLGDTAVAVNPNDAKRAKLISQNVCLPIVNRIVPIIGDDYVAIPDPDNDDPKAKYASGFLKVTPAHDPNDWEIGQRHHLPVINVMAPDGKISDQHGWPANDIANADADALPLGMDRYKARTAIVEWFHKNNLLEDVRPYQHTVGHSYRSHVPIEPYLSDQWYVKVTDERLAGAALRAMAHDQHSDSEGCTWKNKLEQISDETKSERCWQGHLRFHPSRYAKTFQTWNENIRDWCISRQLWWGHRIPVWTYNYSTKRSQAIRNSNPPIDDTFDVSDLIHTTSKDDLADQTVLKLKQQYPECIVDVKSGSDQIVADHYGTQDSNLEGTLYVCVRTDAQEIIRVLEAAGFEQDSDVLDTWFSSALWPFSTMGWPQPTPQLQKWNPSNLLCTAREIITLWVSRMVMMNLYFLNRLPFTDVYVHAMIQDGDGRKMSKSLGNGVDPLDIIHSHGADAMRFTLTSMTTNTQDVRLPVTKAPKNGRNTSEKFDFGRNFANKLWNAVRFALKNLQQSSVAASTFNPQSSALRLSLPDRWILSRLTTAVSDTNSTLATYEFSIYVQRLYDFIWRDFCDWYVEAIKTTVRQNSSQCRVLAAVLDVILRLLHPVMPFITEKLWEHLNGQTARRSVEGLTIPSSQLLTKATWPVADESLIDSSAEKQFEIIQQLVAAVRELRIAYRIPPQQIIALSGSGPENLNALFTQQGRLIEALAKVELKEFGLEIGKPANAAETRVADARLYAHDLVDPNAERQRLTRLLKDASKSVKTLQGRLDNKGYIDKAPPHLVEQTRNQLADTEKEARTLQEQLAALD